MTRRDALRAVALAGLPGIWRASAVRASATPPARWEDFPARLQGRLRALGVTDWDMWAAAQRAETTERVREGSADHLIAIALQSGRFTALPRVEPAVSARAFVESGRIPADADARLLALASALRRRDPALGAALRLLPAGTPAATIGRALREDYARVMRFLHEKEFVARSAADVARLYQSRGLSTDTGIDACYAVADAIGAMPLEGVARRVLVVGPGVELGPRTGLDDGSLGQSVQPMAVLDALRANGRAARDISIETLDVNPLVVDVVAQASAAAVPPSLVLLSSLSSRTHRLVPAYAAWLETWGRDVGVRPSIPQPLADGRLRRQVRPARQAWSTISARLAHVALDTIPGPYDVVVATNVLTYLGDAPLVAAIGMIGRALRPGGVLIHNDRRDLMAQAGADAGLPLVQARTVAFSAADAEGRVAHDWAFLHRLTD